MLTAAANGLASFSVEVIVNVQGAPASPPLDPELDPLPLLDPELDPLLEPDPLLLPDPELLPLPPLLLPLLESERLPESPPPLDPEGALLSKWPASVPPSADVAGAPELPQA